MSPSDERVGTCPMCERAIPESHLFLRYESDDDRAILAECPACQHVVYPV